MKALLKTPYPMGLTMCAALGGAIGMGMKRRMTTTVAQCWTTQPGTL